MIAMQEQDLRRDIIKTAKAMNAQGTNQGTSGNISARIEGGFLITPSGIDYEACTLDDIIRMSMDGTPEGPHKPSSEWRLHRDLLAARPEVQAVLHAHPTFATALACLRRGIPAFHYMVAVAGGRDIRCAPYATFGTEELSGRDELRLPRVLDAFRTARVLPPLDIARELVDHPSLAVQQSLAGALQPAGGED